MTSEPKAEYKSWAMYLQSTLPEHELKVFSYQNDARTHHIDIARGHNAHGVVAATIGVMDCSQGQDPSVPIFTEILMDWHGGNEAIDSVLSAIAFCMLRDGWKAAPGVVFQNVIEMFLPGLEVKHVLFYPPMQWGDAMDSVPLGTKVIHPLLAIPITQQENELIRASGLGVLEELWTRTGCDVYDWSRKSAA
jgi:hypothetical protein